MKAAVVFTKGTDPKYVSDFETPIKKSENEVILHVKASAIKNLDKLQASGKHYSTQGIDWVAKVVGGDGVGVLENGKRVYAMGQTGMLAEQAVVNIKKMVELPDNIDLTLAAALPNAVMGSALAMRFKADLQTGETVLINGATGVTGKMAVQIAKYYGAKNIIVTGRNENALKALEQLGATDFVSLNQEPNAVVSQIKALHALYQIDVVLDYLWGSSAEGILNALKGSGGFTHKTRYVAIGGMISDEIALSCSILRSTNLQISGSGIGSWTPEEVKLLITEVLPEMFQLAAEKKLTMDLHEVSLQNIESVWNQKLDSGTRLVITI